MKSKLFSLILFLCLSFPLMAQVRISGTVSDNLGPMIGATVMEKGTTNGDLVRWGDAEKELADHYKTLPVFFGYVPGKTGADLNADGSNFDEVYNLRYFDVQAYTGVDYHFIKGKNELLPYPASEIANNPNLVQNPGY